MPVRHEHVEWFEFVPGGFDELTEVLHQENAFVLHPAVLVAAFQFFLDDGERLFDLCGCFGDLEGKAQSAPSNTV